MTTKKLFGTDGIRGQAGAGPITSEGMAKLGRILGILAQSSGCGAKLITIGRDTRSSGVYLEKALCQGLASAGADCKLLGVLPTSAIALIGEKMGASFSLVISASHNPHTHNGLKIFGPD